MSKNVHYSSVSKSDSGDELVEAVVLSDAPVVVPAAWEYAQVCAPTTLTGGYELTVDIEGEYWVVLVPQEGVKEGELFRAAILHKIVTKEALAIPVEVADPHSIPTGRWRDGLCDCCTHGCCHALCCLTTWCRPLALGQVMQRMNVSLGGIQVPPGTGVSPFKFMVAFVIGLHIVSQAISAAMPPPTQNEDGTISFDTTYLLCLNVLNVFQFAFVIYFVYLIYKTRGVMRRTYNIPESRNCVGCEDICSSFWCACCVISQMARHTVDYTKYDSACCTETGVGDDVPPTLPNSVV